MSLSILTIGDPHFKNNNVKETTEMIDELNQVLNTHKFDIIICLGDLLDRHDKIDMFPLIRVVEFIKNLSYKLPVYAIIGNHDRSNNTNFLTREHPFTALSGHKDIFIIDTVELVEVGGFKLVFVPYVPPGRFMDAINTNKNINLS